MATDLLLPDGLAPSNLHLAPSVKARFIDGDVLGICERLAEISPRLFLLELSDPEVDHATWMVMEACDDGVQRAVIPERLKELDARVLERVRYLLHVPFEHRLAAIDAENAKYEADHHEDTLEEMYERMGGEFNRMLYTCGFTEHRPTSYPTVAVASGGKRLR